MRNIAHRFHDIAPCHANNTISGVLLFCTTLQVVSYYKLGRLAASYYDICYIVKYRLNPSTVSFRVIFGELLSDSLKTAVVEELERHAPRHVIERVDMFEVGDLMLVSGSCNVTLLPVNYTHSMSTFGPTATTNMPSTSLSMYRKQVLFYFN